MAINRNLDYLHPVFRKKHEALLEKLKAEQIPFKLFEGYRPPARQAWLYGQGRTRPGAIVTRAQPWKSIHQYGLAGDYVLYINGNWSWDDSGDRRAWWSRLHELAQVVGLRPLSFEKPHLQVTDVSLGALRGGRYPEGGDESWANNLANEIFAWSGNPPAPPVPSIVPDRPPVADDTEGTGFAAGAAAGQQFRVNARRGLRLREGPGTEFDVVDILRYNREVTVIAESGDWCQIDTEGDGAADGYCHRGYLVPQQFSF